MPTVIQRNFSAGEIAPVLYSRVDTTRYQTGLRTCKNFFVMRHGGVRNRAGTQFIGEVSDSTQVVRLIEFIFNTDQTYMLEFGEEYMRVIRNGEYVIAATKTITGITQAMEAVVTATSHGFSNNQEIAISGVLGMTEVNGRNFKVQSVTTHTFKITYMDGTNVNSLAFGAYVSGGTAERIYEISTPYLEDDLSTLKYVQSADVITIVHPSYAPRNLSRSAHTSWSLTAITFAPTAVPPTNLGSSGGTASGSYDYVVTTVDQTTFEESLASVLENSSEATALAPVTLTWTITGTPQQYNVYKTKNDVYGYIGSAGDDTFVDDGIDPNITISPPLARNPFSGTDNYPSVVTYFQQRLMLANTNNNTEIVYGSKTSLFYNFTVNTPQQNDDSLSFNLVGRQVNAVKNMIDLGNLIMFTQSAEWAIQGDESGILRPGAINPKQHSYNGSASLAPIIIDGSAIYVQARDSVVRDLGFEVQSDGYRGNDLTIFSAHLFDSYTILDWAYQKIPHSIVWAVRSDGILLALTYVREQQIVGWTRHDLGGTVENVNVIPEGNEDAVYVVVKRTVDGVDKRYVEKINTRQIDDIKDAVFMDSSLSYDGRNDSNAFMIISGGTTWDYTETLTLTASTATFLATDVGNEIQLTALLGDDLNPVRFTIDAYTSSTVVTGRANRTVPDQLQDNLTTDWAVAVDELTGLWHLEGEEVSVLGDGLVVANPNNSSYDVLTVTNGTLTLDRPYAVLHVGLPITADLETLDIDTPTGETISDKHKIVSQVNVRVDESRGIWAGSTPPEDEDADFLGGLYEMKIRNAEGYDDPIELKSEVLKINIRPEWNSNGRVFIRQTDPLPLTVLSIAPAGAYPFKG